MQLGSWGKITGRQGGASSMQRCWGVPAAQDAGPEHRWSSSLLQFSCKGFSVQCLHSAGFSHTNMKENANGSVSNKEEVV